MENKKILVVEDEAPMLTVLKEKLELEGFNVLTATNGEEGLLEVKNGKPDLVLLDILMPVMDGITMLKKMRETDYGREIPVIVLTNLFDAEKVTECIERGAFDYLVKVDWNLKEVVDLIKKKIGE